MDDNTIIDLLFERQDSVLEQLQQKYGALCHNVAYSILDSEEDSKECMNDVLMKLWSSIPPDRPESLKAYLVRITRNLSIDRLRHRRSAKRNSMCDVPLSELEACIPGGTSPDEQIDCAELGRLISRFLRELTPEYRFIFMGRYWNGRSIKSLASEFDMTCGYVKSLLFRLRGSLREMLEKEGFSI